MTLLVKLGVAVIGGGSLAAGSYGIYELVRPKNIEQQLKWEGIDLADFVGTTDDSFWNDTYTKYNADQDNKFTNLAPSETISSGATLKNHCNSVIKRNLPDEDNLKRSRMWCVKPSKTTE